MDFLKIIVVLSIVLCIAGGIVSVFFQAITGVELSPTLIDKWYTVFGLELGASALIQVTKIMTDEIKRRNKIKHMKENDIKLERSDFNNEQNDYYGGYTNSEYYNYDDSIG